MEFVHMWNATTGYNDLGATVIISKSAPKDPGTLPEGIEEVTGDGLQVTGPKKIIENGIFYILMPDGRKYYCF